MAGIARVVDGHGPPRLRLGMSLICVQALPAGSAGPQGELADQLTALREAGVEAAQAHAPDIIESIREAGLIATALARVDRPDDARAAARRGKAWGCDCTTLHVGTGFETDDEAAALMAAVVEAADAEGHALFVETHRATATQDMKRTLDLVRRVPALRFNGDFSHWYTGSEMTYGSVDEKLARIEPVLARTRFIHGRVSTPGCIQIPVRDGTQREHVDVFRKFWARSFRGFLHDAVPGEVMGFYPELLPPSYHYARTFRTETGELREEGDRWHEALHMIEIARECWADAASTELT